MRDDIMAQAAALEQLLESSQGAPQPMQAFIEGAISCTEKLILDGSPSRALAILGRISERAARAGELEQLRVEVAHLRALAALSANVEGLQRARHAKSKFSHLQASHAEEYVGLRLFEGTFLWRLNRVSDAVDLLSRVRSELLAWPESNLHSICAAQLASSYIAVGDWELAREYSLEAYVSARRCSSSHNMAVALGNLCIAERGRARWSASEEAGRSSLALYEQAGSRAQAAHVRRSLAITLWKRGKLELSLQMVNRAIDEAAEQGHTTNLVYATLLRAVVLTHLGRHEETRKSISSAFDDLVASESRHELLRLEYLADTSLEEGNAAEAMRRYDQCLAGALALIPRGDIVAELRRRRSECFTLLGRPTDGHEEAHKGLTLCRELGDRYEEAATYRVLALASAAIGKIDDAKQFFTQGFAMFDDIETPYEWGKLWMSYGDWLCGEHAGRHLDYTEAHSAYGAAIEHFAHIGAEFKLAQARERLAALETRMREEGEELRVADARPVLPRRPKGNRELAKRAEWAFETFQLVTHHAPLLEMLEQISRVAASDLPVLVLGESGTGKELIARGLHALSGRTGPIVEVNCGAIAASLMESECFGHLQGSFTGAIRDKAGLFEVAEHGTVFLDEIGEMPLDMQAKLLRFLENGEVRRVGATTGRIVDVRLVAATNRDEARMKSGEGFRSDLYYRLAHAVFTLPPLRERHADVELLVDHFLAHFNEEHRKHVTMSQAARKRLAAYSFPGNVRELRSLLERLVVSSAPDHVITPREVPSSEGDTGPRSFVEETAAQEKRRIVDALEKAHYVKADAARMLRMSRTTLIGKMKRYRIPG